MLDITTLMPRHPANGRPRHRAQRQGTWPSRGARSGPAVTRQVSAVTGSVFRTLGTAFRTLGTAFQALGSARMAVARPEHRRLIRGVIFTPWFAVGVGIVIAASLTLAAPRAALTFPSTKSGHCAQIGCTVTHSRLAGPSPAIKREVKLHLSKRHGDLLAGLMPASGIARVVQVQYGLLPRFNDRFVAVIVIIGHKPLGKWSLRFVLPGAHIGSLMWADWAPIGPNGVLVEGAPSPWPRSAANEARIVIFGSGAPSWPRACVFDGRTCVFRGLSRTRAEHTRGLSLGPRPGRRPGQARRRLAAA
jgi:hypothetical protein